MIYFIRFARCDASKGSVPVRNELCLSASFTIFSFHPSAKIYSLFSDSAYRHRHEFPHTFARIFI